MGRAVPALEVSAEERGELERLIRTHGTAQQIALRARMILLSVEGLKIGEITARLDVWRKTVSQWRKRWRSGPNTSAEARKRLSDAPRSGAPAKIKPKQACAIIALACETPESSGLPFTHWGERALAEIPLRIIRALSVQWDSPPSSFMPIASPIDQRNLKDRRSMFPVLILSILALWLDALHTARNHQANKAA